MNIVYACGLESRARWIDTGRSIKYLYNHICSNCGETCHKRNLPEICPNCKQKMRGKD